MLKKYYLYILSILITSAAFILLKSNKKSSIASENKFQIENTSSINKIFIADRNGTEISLIKKNESWTVNNQFTVREDAIKTLLETANKIRIKKPVSKSAFSNVVKFIATTGVYIEFFQDEKLIKSYTIGSNTPDHLGTYMLLKGSKKPFVIHIPSFNGFLSPRYGIQSNEVDIMNWRSNIVFNLSLQQIKYIKYTDFHDSTNSYILNINPFKLINSEKKSIPFKNNKIIRLLNNFKNLNCEAFKYDKIKINSTTQIEELIVNSDTLRTYKISDLDYKKKEDNFTVERKYATLNNKELMLIQDYVFNKVLINIDELTK